MKSQSKAKLSAQAPSTMPQENAEGAKGEGEGPTSGYDRFQFISGAVYTGNWRLLGDKKVKHGFGKLQFGGTTGAGEFGSEEYEGDWQDDLMHGYGRYKYASGAEYSGQWHKGKQQGRGEYVWPDGSRYSGEWDGHVMNGEGQFIDRDGLEWPGIFVKGGYETKDQKQLRAEREVRRKQAAIEHQSLSFFSRFAQLCAKSDKKTYVANLTPMFGTYDTLNEMLSDPYTRLDEKPFEKWGELIKQFVVAAPPPSSGAGSGPQEVKTPPPASEKLSWAEGVSARALSHATAATILDSERIKAEQLSSGDSASAGQIVEITKEVEGALKAELVLIAVGEGDGAWVLAHFKEL